MTRLVIVLCVVAMPAHAATRIWVNGIETSTRDVGDGVHLQAVLNAAKDGDLIELEGGTVITRTTPLVLPKRSTAAKVITLQTRAVDTLMPPGTVVTRAHGPKLAEIRRITPNFAVLQTAPAAAYWRLRGLRIRNLAEGPDNYPTIGLGFGATGTAETAKHIELDRILVDLDDVKDPHHNYQQVMLSGEHLWLHQSHISGIRSATDGDYSAVWVAFALGPVVIEDNFLEAGGETIYIGSGNFGTGEVAVPTDVTIRRNHITRNPAWRGVYTMKNLFEIKMGKRVTLAGNLLTNAWVDAQATAIVVTLRSEMMCATCAPTEPQAEITDLTITNNILKGASAFITVAGIDASGYGDNAAQGGAQWPATNVKVINNLAIDIDPEKWGAGNYLTASTTAPLKNFTFAHNTLQTNQAYGTGLNDVEGLPNAEKFVWLNNVMTLAVTCFNHAQGGHNAALEYTTNPDRVVRGNVWGDDSANHSTLQPMNRYTDTPQFILEQFTPDWHVKAGSPYKGAAVDAQGNKTGKDLGADMDAIRQAVGPRLWAAAGFAPTLPTPPPVRPELTLPWAVLIAGLALAAVGLVFCAVVASSVRRYLRRRFE